MHSTQSGDSEFHNSAACEESFALLVSERQLQRFVEAWKAGKLPKPEWTHAAHVAMAAYFAFDHAAEATFAIMKAGILHHNTSVGTPNTEDNGYHETLTRFWSSEIGGLSGLGATRRDGKRRARRYPLLGPIAIASGGFTVLMWCAIAAPDGNGWRPISLSMAPGRLTAF